MKNMRKALALLLSLLLCCSMLVGTTFAWFTDSVTSNNNIIKSGNLDVELYRNGTDSVEEDDALFLDKNGKAVPVDVPAQLMNSRTMVPARVIAEAFGADVAWNGNGRVVLITE